VPGDVATRIRAITARHSLLPTSHTRTAMGRFYNLLSPKGTIRGFNVPPVKYAGLGACFRPEGVWVTKTQRKSVLPTFITILVKRESHFRLLSVTVFIADSDFFTIPAI